MEVDGESNSLTEGERRQPEAANRARGEEKCTVNVRLIVRLLWVLLSLLLMLGAALGFVDAENLERLRPVLAALVRPATERLCNGYVESG